MADKGRTKFMSCALSEKVSLLIDGELPPTEMRVVEQHLATCAACQQMRADFLGLRQQLSAYAVVRDPHAERRALAHVLAQRGATQDVQPWRKRLSGAFALPHFNFAFAAVAAALLVVACVAGLVAHRNAQHNTAVAANAPTNSNQHKEAQSASVPAAAPKLNPPKEIAREQTAEPGTAGVAGRGRQQLTTANNRVPANKRHAPAVNAPAQSASDKSARERRTPERLPRPELSTPRFVAAAADAATVARVRPADAETLTARHVEQAELLLRTFRSARAATGGAAGDLSYARSRAQQLLYQNIVLRREATGAGNVQVATLLDSLEPILLDIANLPAAANAADINAIRERVQRKHLVALLQINSTALARAYE